MKSAHRTWLTRHDKGSGDYSAAKSAELSCLTRSDQELRQRISRTGVECEIRFSALQCAIAMADHLAFTGKGLDWERYGSASRTACPVVVSHRQEVRQPIGSQFASLPPGSRSMVVNGTQYYQNGANYYKPYHGSNGEYYEVEQAP